MSAIELVLDESIDDGGLPHCLIAYKHNLELDRVFLIGCEADLIVALAHLLN
jgi:hypothetical protein